MEWYWWLVIAAAIWVGLLVLALAFIAGATRWERYR
jgi:hypothetical protein